MKLLNLTKEQKTGLFALLTLIALYITVNYLKGKDFLSSRNTYYAVFENVQGLTPTGPVYLKGFKVGTIETISYNEEQENFCLELKISSDYTFHKKSTVESFSADIMGTRALRIINSQQSTPMENRDTFLTSCEQGITEMLASEFTDLSKKLTLLITSADTLVNNINLTLNPQLREELSQSVTHLRNTLSNAQKLTASLEKSTPAIESTISNMKRLSSKLDTSAYHLNNTLHNTTEITAQLKEADLAATIISLRDLLDKMKDPKSTTGKLLTTDSLHNSTDRLIKDLDNLIKSINDDPKRYIKISIF